MPAPLIKEPHLVLVASSKSTVGQMTPEKIRNLYLGTAILINGQSVKPLLNYSDGYSQEMFMQKVMLMSTHAYEYRIISHVFRKGGNRPPVYTGVHKLINALKTNQNAVTYMYSDEAGAHPDLKIINILWEDKD